MIILVVLVPIVLAFLIFALKTGLFAYWNKLRQTNVKKIKLTSNYIRPKEDIKSFKIDVPAGRIHFEQSTFFQVTDNSPYDDIKFEDGVLSITKKPDMEYDPEADLNVDFPNRALIEIKYPTEKEFEEIYIKMIEGSVDIYETVCDNLTIDISKGRVKTTEMNVNNQSTIKLDYGEVIVDLGDYNDLQVDVIKGTISCQGKIYGNNHFNVQFGSINLNILRFLKFFTINAESKSGFVGFMGRRTTRVREKGKPDSIDCAIEIGNMTINLEE